MSVLGRPDLWDKIIIDELGKKIAGEIKTREIIFLCCMGRLVKNASFSSFNLLIHSGSSAGKDYVSNKVLNLFSKDHVFKRTRISEKVLNHWEPYEDRGFDSWNESVLYLVDIGERILNCDALKVMCSEGSFITITEKVMGKLKAVDKEIKGKPVIITTSATSTPSEEITNRFLILRLDESEEQTKRVMEFETKLARDGFDTHYDERVINALKDLKAYKVKIPFADKIREVFPFGKIRMRRLYNTFLDMIKAVTVVHQFQRSSDGDFLISEFKDYDIAKECFQNLCLGLPEIPLDKRKESIVEVLKNAKIMLSASEIQPLVKPHVTLQNLIPHINSLVNLHLLESFDVFTDYGRAIQKFKLSEEALTFKAISLPNSHDLC